jgi:hypothetical protein
MHYELFYMEYSIQQHVKLNPYELLLKVDHHQQEMLYHNLEHYLISYLDKQNKKNHPVMFYFNLPAESSTSSLSAGIISIPKCSSNVF